MSTVDSILLRISPSRRWSSWSQICVGTVDSMPLCLSQSRRRSSWSQVCVMMQSQICKNITTILVLLTTVPLLSDSDFSSFRAHVSNSFAKFLRSLFYQFIHTNVTRFINSFTISVTLHYSMPSRVEVTFTHSRTWSVRLWFQHDSFVASLDSFSVFHYCNHTVCIIFVISLLSAQAALSTVWFRLSVSRTDSHTIVSIVM